MISTIHFSVKDENDETIVANMWAVDPEVAAIPTAEKEIIQSAMRLIERFILGKLGAI